MKSLKIVLIYLFIIILNFIGVDFYVGKSSLAGGEVGMLSLLILIVISSTSIISIILYFFLKLKLKIGILKAILLNQLIYLLFFISLGFNPFQNKSDFWVIFISFIVQFIIISVYFLTKFSLKNNEKST